MKIIIVDDEPRALRIFGYMIAGFPEHELAGAFSDSRTALDYIRGGSVDVAFLDIEMPQINGFQLADAIHSLGLNTKIVFVTAYHGAGSDMAKYGAAACLIKPYGTEDLRRVLDELK